MNIRVIEHEGRTVGELVSDVLQLRVVQDVLEIMVTAGYSGCESLIIHERNLDPGFFDLKTGLAGEILQKFSNYRMRLAIVGSFGKYGSQSLKDFIVECNRGRTVFFVEDVAAAMTRLSQV